MNATGGHDRVGRAQLTGAFTTPRWLRDLGRSSWLLVGVLALVIGLVWLLAETYTIVGPMVCALIVSVVAMPLVSILDRHMPRALAAALVLLAVAAVTVLIAVVVVAGITGQNAELSAQAASGVDRLQSWLQSAGVDSSGRVTLSPLQVMDPAARDTARMTRAARRDGDMAPWEEGRGDRSRNRARPRPPGCRLSDCQIVCFAMKSDRVVAVGQHGCRR